MKKNLCVLLALLTAVMMITSSMFVFASDVEETGDAAVTEEVPVEEVVEEVTEEGAEAVEGEEGAEPIAEEPVEEAVEEAAAVPVQILEITVNPDGSSTSTLTMPVPPEYESQIEGIVAQYEGMGITTELVDDFEGFKAIKVSTVRDANTPCNVSTPGSESAAFDAWIVNGLFEKTTIMNASYDFAGGYYTENEEIAKIIIHLPSRVTEHNAESVDGNAYTWILRGGVNNPIRFIIKSTTLVGWISLAVIVLLVILIILSVVLKKKKGDGEAVEEAVEGEDAYEIAEEADAIEEVVENPVEETVEGAEDSTEDTEENTTQFNL